jgi:glycosyltransferase involved in cell wall biosynthesis
MSLLTRLRRLSRALPIGPRLLHRLRRMAGLGFRLSAWARYGRTRRPARPRPGPICVVGFHGSVLGIGEAARSVSRALKAAGAEVIDWDISPRFGHDVRLGGDWTSEPPADAGAVLLFLNPRELVQLMAMTGGAPFKDRFCAGCWAWELERLPPDWSPAFGYVDEVWACSGFVADAVAARAPRSVTVRTLPHPIARPTAAPDRAAFDLPEKAVLMLTAFDVRSGFTRKNPIAAVRAFRQANTSGRGLLICKAAGIEGAPELMDALRAEIGDSGDVRLMTDWLSGGQMAALIASSDIILSLHRSEGFGLLLAQGMAAGKAVVATGWSGNLEFMGPHDSALIGWRPAAVHDPQGLYDGGQWAEPDLADAAAKLKALIEDAEGRRAMGERAAARIQVQLDPVTLGAMVRGWLGPAGERRR